MKDLLQISEDAERQLRKMVAEAGIRDPHLDAFVAHIQTLRTSDLFGFIANPTALKNVLDPQARPGLETAKLMLVRYAAGFALKDEIDRRFPIPAVNRPSPPRGVSFEPIDSDNGLHMTWDRFVAACRDGSLTDDDGFAQLATATDVFDLGITPSQASDLHQTWATHVVWYNK